MRLNKKSKGTTKLKKYFMGGMPGGAPPQGGPPMGGPPMGGPPMGGPPPPGMGGGAPGAGGMPPELLAAIMAKKGGAGKGGPSEGDPAAKKGAVDLETFKTAINFAEASGEMDYSLTNKSGTSAIGPYQIMYSTYSKILKEQFGVESKEDFIGNKEVQEELMNFLVTEEYPKLIDSIKEQYGPGGTKLKSKKGEDFSEEGLIGNLTDIDLMALEHFLGHENLRDYFAHKREGKKYTPPGKNLSVEEYLKRVNSSYSGEKERPATEQGDSGEQGPVEGEEAMAQGGPPMGGPGRPQFMPGPSDVPEGLTV